MTVELFKDRKMVREFNSPEALKAYLQSLKSGYISQNEETLGELKNVNITNIVKLVKVTNWEEATYEVVKDKVLDIVVERFLKVHPDYDYLAGRILADNIWQHTEPTFSKAVEAIATRPGVISSTLCDFVKKNKERCDRVIHDIRDYTYKYMSMSVMEKSFLIRKDGVIYERPQYLWMRAALSLVQDPEHDWNKVVENYELLSKGIVSLSTPALMSSGTPVQNTASCYLMSLEDSAEGLGLGVGRIMKLITKGGGVGVSLAHIRVDGKEKDGDGAGKGVRAVMGMLNKVPIKRAGNVRQGAVATYLPIWHADIFHWLDSRTAVGDGKDKTHNLFMGIMICDEFMRRIEDNSMWYTMCPSYAEKLTQLTGREFDEYYLELITDGKYEACVEARELLNTLVNTINTTGMPYVIFSDHVNKRNNLHHLGVIESSNLCAEIMQYSSANDIAVCNLSTICVKKFVNPDTKTFDFQGLVGVARTVCRYLNVMIDKYEYSMDSQLLRKYADDGSVDFSNNVLSASNRRNRPMGVGIQGLYDALCLLDVVYSSKKAAILAGKMYEAIYFGLISESCLIAREKERPHDSFAGSKFSEGVFQFHMIPGFDCIAQLSHDLFDWNGLLKDVKKYGTYNGLFTAQPPTASSSQINGNVESIEAISSNRYTWCVQSGSFTVLNEHMVRDFEALGIWDKTMREELARSDGSVARIQRVPRRLKRKYKTVREIGHNVVLRLASYIQPFIDQSISLNHHMINEDLRQGESDVDIIYNHLRKAWKQNFKTGSYYMRAMAAQKAADFGKINEEEEEEDFSKIYSGDVKRPSHKLTVRYSSNQDCVACAS
ncbi:Ribonucleoside-diphosphate reductase large subunit [Holothuria leucospilota]|uniref:Ribonucleoside-diphosphate reductase n=1 Tax=Holothuria leucospilota TaxID=206669 RepID=A0A9Q0YBQ2_HOLLE|nr:Ribonucleoside-diphosphate reductase large subunit [Holothuria leucospilota]